MLTFLPNGMFKPYAFATYGQPISDPNYDGRNALQLGSGLAVVSGRLTGAVEAGTLLLQSGQSSMTVGPHLRLAVQKAQKSWLQTAPASRPGRFRVWSMAPARLLTGALN